MRDRLIELLEGFCIDDDIGVLVDTLLANGVIVPPCKAGTKVYCACLASGVCLSGKVLSYSLNESGFWAYCNYEYGIEYWHPIGDFGKTVFLTREEAEQALKGE